jgi:hypothetical protein
MHDLKLIDELRQMPDFANFFRGFIKSATLSAILGSTMLRMNPNFVENMFTFDKMFATFSPGFPRFMMSESYAICDTLADCFKRWYRYAREHFNESMVDADGDGDPIWGSSMMRQR